MARNLCCFPFGSVITRRERRIVETTVVRALEDLQGELAGSYHPLYEMDETTKERLIHDHFLFKEGDRFLEAAGLNRDWPDARGIFHNPGKTILVWVNEEDQLRIISMEPGADLQRVFARLARALAELERCLAFAHSKRLGYLTSCPTNLGTACRCAAPTGNTRPARARSTTFSTSGGWESPRWRPCAAGQRGGRADRSGGADLKYSPAWTPARAGLRPAWPGIQEFCDFRLEHYHCFLYPSTRKS